MSGAPVTDLAFADLIAPMSPEEFAADYYDQRPLHIPGALSRLSPVLAWDELSGLLQKTTIWTSDTIKLMRDGAPVPASEYCRPAPDPGGRPMMRPVPGKVMALVKHGASLVCNDMEFLTPTIRVISHALKKEFSARLNVNLYCTWQARQAFASHYDKHDVFAVHVDGEKRWNLYANRADNPILHERYRQLTVQEHDRAKGPVAQQLTLRPGDLLYLPRGLYHDAIASSGASLHLTFGVKRPTGHDFLQMLLENAVSDPVFRRNFPRPSEGREALRDHLGRLADHILEATQSEELLDAVDAYQDALRQTAKPYSLPVQGEGRRATETPSQTAEGR